MNLKHLKPDTELRKGGPVAKRVAQLLSDQELSLQDVADRVVKEIKGATTSARSVASIAADLRRMGYSVPDRRRRNGVKHAPPAKKAERRATTH